MHGLYPLAMLFPPNFWTTFSVQAPVKIVAIAGLLCTLIQIIKVKFPSLGGWWAVALNVILATAGVLSLTPVQDMLSVQTLGNVIVAALAAAGIHGSSKLLSQSPMEGQRPVLAQKAVALMCCLALATTCLTGCSNFERETYQTLATSKTVIDQAQADYEARKIPRTQAAFMIISAAKVEQTLAVQSMEAYEEIKFAKGSQSALDSQQAIVSAALAQLPAMIKAIEGLKAAIHPAPTPAAPTGAMLRWPTPVAA